MIENHSALLNQQQLQAGNDALNKVNALESDKELSIDFRVDSGSQSH
ncbi:MAG: hypothetical protein ACM37W_28475 [Actinomycetota bacterium]